jgi:hypothetical protein
MPARVKVIKPLRIACWQLEVGDEFDVVDWKVTKFGTFFRPLGVGMREGTSWLFTEKTFEIILDTKPNLV